MLGSLRSLFRSDRKKIDRSGKGTSETTVERVPDQPFGCKIASVSSAGIDFYWKKPEISEGYEVFRGYEEDGDYELIFTAPRRNIGEYTDPDFDHSVRTVYYKVRSFITGDDGSLIYSDLTSPTAAVYSDIMTVEREVTYMYSGTARSLLVTYGWGEPADPLWTSSDESVAKVDSTGTITAVSSGECVVTCVSSEAGQTVTSRVVVDRKADGPLPDTHTRYSYNNDSGIWENDNSKTNNAVIMMAGDMMCSSVQMRNQRSENGEWDFRESFFYIKQITKDSDFAVANLETLLAPGWPYMVDEAYIENKNNCNATPRYLDAVISGGFDAVMLANNHNCDGGLRALLETIETVRSYEIAATGVFSGPDDKRFFIADVNGIKVGFLAYMTKGTGFNHKERSWSSEDKATYINIFGRKKAFRDIKALREAGAEYVIVYMHWGMKNFRNLTKPQLDDAQAVADAGADFIVGSNPHVVQPYCIITSENGKDVPCYYSMGNFLATMNQIEGNRDSIIVRIRLEKDGMGNVTLTENNYIPCRTYKTVGDRKWVTVSVSPKYNSDADVKGRKKNRLRIAEAIGPDARNL